MAHNDPARSRSGPEPVEGTLRLRRIMRRAAAGAHAQKALRGIGASDKVLLRRHASRGSLSRFGRGTRAPSTPSAHVTHLIGSAGLVVA